MGNIVARLQVLPGGIIIGHIVPSSHPANDTGVELEAGMVYEAFINYSGNLDLCKKGKADYQMPSDGTCGMSLDRFLVEAQGNHCTYGGGK